MRPNTMTSFAAGAICALVIGSGTAYAATGGKFILGKSNQAGATSTLTNKSGTALSLNSKTGTAPLKVSSAVKVARLNADKLDGMDSTAFASAAGKTGYVTGDGQWADLDEDGYYDTIVAFAECPAGSRLTGGGQSDWTATGVVATSQPLGDGIWAVAVFADPTEAATDVAAHAVCYNPRGAVRGATSARTGVGADSRQAFMDSLAGRVGTKE